MLTLSDDVPVKGPEHPGWEKPSGVILSLCCSNWGWEQCVLGCCRERTPSSSCSCWLLCYPEAGHGLPQVTVFQSPRDRPLLLCSCPCMSQLKDAGPLRAGSTSCSMPASITAERTSANPLCMNGVSARTAVSHFLQGHVILGYGMLLNPRLQPTPATWLAWQVSLGPSISLPGPG